ncbi:MAG: peptidoglycan DD-metalloendopeptidase family protein [Caldisericaceae bacterium]
MKAAAGGYHSLALVREAPQISKEFQYPFDQSWPCTLGFGEGFYYAQQGKWYLGHLGEDYGAPEGTPVLAIAVGKVVVAQPDKYPGQKIGWGNVVVLQHTLDNGQVLYSQYAHLQQINVIVGEDVRRGQLIGTVGHSGNATGPHLHLEIKNSPTLGPGIAGSNFAEDIKTFADITYYRPSLFIEQNRQISTSLIGYVIGTGGAGLRLHAEPGLGGQIITVMPEGSEVTILDGLVYADGYTWRRVQYGLVSGWAAAKYLQIGQVSQAPPAPSGLTQWKSDGTTILPAQGTTAEREVVLGATVPGPNTETFKVQFEVRRVGQSFSVPTHQSGWSIGGETVKVRVGSLGDGGYQWRARLLSAEGRASDWVMFGNGGTTADFTVRYVTKPTGEIEFSPQLVFVGDLVQFRAQESGRTGWSFKWEFSDGQTLTGGTVTRTFGSAGEYTVRLVINTSDGLQAINTVSFSVLTRELIDAVDRLVNRTSTLLDDVVATERKVADAADYFNKGVNSATMNIIANAILQTIGFALDSAEFKKWLELSLGKEFWLTAVEELSSTASEEIVDMLYNNKKSFRDIFVTNLESYVNQKKMELAQLRTEVLSQATNLDAATAQSLAKELNARSSGNVALRTIFDGRAYCPITFADLKSFDESSWTYVWGTHIFNVSWGGLIVASSALGGPTMSIVLPILDRVRDTVGSQLSIIEGQSIDAQMLSLTLGVLADGVPFAKRLFDNTAKGLELVRQGQIRPAVSGSMQIQDVTLGHRQNIIFINREIVQEAYSEVTIVNTGTAAAEYRLDVSYPESFTTVQLFPFELPGGIASRKYNILVLRTYPSVWLEPGQQQTVTIKYLTRQGGKIPKEKITFILTVTTKENERADGVYLVNQVIRSFNPQFVEIGSGAVAGDASLAAVSAKEEDWTSTMSKQAGKRYYQSSDNQGSASETSVFVEYPLHVRLLNSGNSEYILQIIVANPVECSISAVLQATLPTDAILLDRGGGSGTSNTLTWELNLTENGLVSLQVNYRSSQQSSPTNYPAVILALYDNANMQWLPFTETTEPVILDRLVPPVLRRLNYANDKLEINVFGRPGAQYVLEASTNLVDWLPILNFPCTNTPTVIIDENIGVYKSKFYRVSTQ